MDIEWDESKRIDILRRRKIDNVYAALIFEEATLTKIDDREDYGEIREVSIGMVDGECFVVVHTERNGVMRIITAWKGGRDEIDAYRAGLARRDQAHEGER